MHLSSQDQTRRYRSSPGGSPRVLVVEDDPDFADLMQSELEAGGYAVDTAASLSEAREQIRSDNDLDLVISDVHLEGESGFSLLLETRATNAPPPILMMSGFVTEEMRELAEATGTSVLAKPFSFGLLHSTIIELLVKRAGLRAGTTPTTRPQ